MHPYICNIFPMRFTLIKHIIFPPTESAWGTTRCPWGSKSTVCTFCRRWMSRSTRWGADFIFIMVVFTKWEEFGLQIKISPGDKLLLCPLIFLFLISFVCSINCFYITNLLLFSLLFPLGHQADPDPLQVGTRRSGLRMAQGSLSAQQGVRLAG